VGIHNSRSRILRNPEWIQIVTVGLLAIAAPFRQLEGRRQRRVAQLALIVIFAISIAKFSERWMGPYSASILWDWLPGALMLIPYWQLGVFFVAPDPAMEERLSAFDHGVFQWLRIRPAETRIPRPILAYLELAYFLVYALIPLGVVVLYRTGLRTKVDFYWAVVLSATYVSYGSTLMIRARPPRLLIGHEGFPMAKTAIRAANRVILDRASIQAITCPSAHVASALAATLVLVHFQTSIGLLFVWAALNIAAATIVGGYHYVADVLSAAMVASFIFAIVCFVA
jgi:hypothetical protein